MEGDKVYTDSTPRSLFTWTNELLRELDAEGTVEFEDGVYANPVDAPIPNPITTLTTSELLRTY